MTIFVYKKLTRNPEIGDTLSWVLSNTLRLRQIMDIKFDRNTLLKCSRMQQNVKFPAFTVSELLRGNQRGVTLYPRPLKLRLSYITCFIYLRIMNQFWHSFVCPWSTKINNCVKLGVRIGVGSGTFQCSFKKIFDHILVGLLAGRSVMECGSKNFPKWI